MGSRRTPIVGLELFAGAGGLALGLEQAGITHQALIEYDAVACRTLRTNRPNWNVIEGDVWNIDFSMFNGIQVVSGGAPCQAFSYAGKKLGFADERGTLGIAFVKCLEAIQPDMFIFENVAGLLSHNNGKTFGTLVNMMSDAGYDVQYQVLNASYYGVGQKRNRLFVIGRRNDLINKIDFQWPEPDEKPTTLKQALENCPVSEGLEYSEYKKKVMTLVPAGGCWTDLPEEVAKEYMGKSYHSSGGRRGMARRLAWDEPCLTLTTSPSQKQTERCHPDETRPLTVREYARIQSFPDEWQFCGSIIQQYKQIGNAVPVELARRMGEAVVKALVAERAQ